MEHHPQVQRIGRYEVVRKIATGGMAELFLARYVGPGGFEKRCALKRILPQFAADQTFTKMFLTEAKVTAQLDHPNIVQIFELGQDDNGQYFIAMEMVNGVNLRQLLTMAKGHRQAIPPELAAYIATQALEGLAYAHELRSSSTGEPLHLVHRDISPQNILVSYEGAVKLVDFGIVKGSTISGETQTGMLKGKVAYMSPEQATGESLDGRSDLFSLAVVLFELITGERPFSAVNELMTLKAILDLPPRPLIELAPECPEGIENAIYRGLAKFPQERFADARSFHLELDHVLRACPVPLGRHVVSDFIQSLTEGSTAKFDATRLKIPRRTPPAGFAQQIALGLDPHRPWDASQAQPAPAPRADAMRADAMRGHGARPDSVDGPATDKDSAPLDVAADPAVLNGDGNPPPFESSPALNASGEPVTANQWGAAVQARPSYAAPYESSVTSAPAVELGSGELAAAGVRQRPWWPVFFVALFVAAWVLIWVWMRTDVDAIIVSPKTPPPRVEQIAQGSRAVMEATDSVADAGGAAATPTLPQATVETPPKAQTAPPKAAAVATKTRSAAIPTSPQQKGSRTAPTSRAESARPTPGRKGRLRVRSTPPRLVVRSQGRRLGRTPLDLELKPGTYPLTLVSRSRGIEHHLTVRIQTGQTTEERVTLEKGRLQVVSRPWAEVFLDGRSVGKTPLTIDAYEGPHELKLVNAEGETRVRTVRVAPKAKRLVRVLF